VHKSAALVTREGNPKGLKPGQTWQKMACKRITANPKTSGGARWNSCVGFSDKNWGDEAKALDFTTKVLKTLRLPKDARESSDVFSSKVREMS